MRSLRAQLAFWILTPLLFVWAFNAWLSYQSAIESANSAHDRTLLGSVLAIAERISVVGGEIVVDLPYSSLEMLESNLQSRVYYRVSVGGRHLTGYEDLRRPWRSSSSASRSSTTASTLASPCAWRQWRSASTTIR
jgi:two-component system sensor histidine kinase TctE